MTWDAKQRRVMLGNVPKFSHDDEESGLRVMPFPGMLIHAFSDLDPNLAETTPKTTRTSRSGIMKVKKLSASRAKLTGSLGSAKLPKASGLKRPLAAKLARGEATRLSSRDQRYVACSKPKLKYSAASAVDRNTTDVLNSIYRNNRISEKHKPEVSTSKGDVLKRRTQKQRQSGQEASSKREQGMTSISATKPVKRTSFLSGKKALGVSPLTGTSKSHEHIDHAPSLPRIKEAALIKSVLKKANRPASSPKTVQFGAEYVREVSKIVYISDEYGDDDDDDDDDASTSVTEQSDFSTENGTTGSDSEEDSDDCDWRQ